MNLSSVLPWARQFNQRIRTWIQPMPKRKAGYPITNEKVQFRYYQMPCCGQLLCWVNPRVPNYCPECGKQSYMALKFGCHALIDSPAWLRVADE